jgi:hypothetical protein
MTKRPTDPQSPQNLLMMSTERPLDSLLPDLREAYEPLPRTALHQRVLEVDTGDDGFEWVMACWEDPGGARALHEQMRDLVEATLLAHLSQPATARESIERHFRRLRLYCFTPIEGDAAQALKPFGFVPAKYQPEAHVGRMAALSDEAKKMGRRLPMSPHSVWVASIAEPTAAALALASALPDKFGTEVWGQTPGFFSKVMAEVFATQHKNQKPIAPSVQGLRAIEEKVVWSGAGVGAVSGAGVQSGVIRWIPPLEFQGLCDLIGVVMVAEWGHELQWAMCDQDPLGLYPPPHFRLQLPDRAPEQGVDHFLVGQQVLQWCMMPLQPGEQVPPLWQWLVGTFEQVRPY